MTGKQITEARDFSAFKVPMQPIPPRVEAAIGRGVLRGDVPFSQARRVLDDDADGMVDAVVRNPDGVLVVCCKTEMPGVTPEMWDWWFGWHGLASERYLLWHPNDHVASAMSEDRSNLRDARARYIGNTSYVDERFGKSDVVPLSIAFKPPRSFGFDEARLAAIGTVICARVGLRRRFVDTGYLAHLVRKTQGGSEMLSRFWLGHIESKIPLLGPLISGRMNKSAVRSKLAPDAAGLALLRHCSEEMGHLARILPALYAKFGNE